MIDFCSICSRTVFARQIDILCKKYLTLDGITFKSDEEIPDCKESAYAMGYEDAVRDLTTDIGELMLILELRV